MNLSMNIDSILNKDIEDMFWKRIEEEEFIDADPEYSKVSLEVSNIKKELYDTLDENQKALLRELESKHNFAESLSRMLSYCEGYEDGVCCVIKKSFKQGSIKRVAAV